MTNVSTTHNQKVSGYKIIGKYLKNLPENPGVYRMLDRGGEVLYVGKAVNLRKRVTNYSKFSGHSLRTIKMIELTCSMMFLTTKNENISGSTPAQAKPVAKPIENAVNEPVANDNDDLPF